MKSRSSHAQPVTVLPDQTVVPLRRVTLGTDNADGKRREAFVQNLVHATPGVIPMADIEPAFMPLVPVCKELATSAGYLDNFWITPAGGIVLGECKLMRNPEARREVVAQALDYARALSTWRYSELERAVRSATNNPDFSLWGLIEDQSDLDEAQFIDAVERRLQFGRFLLLIIGDGIQEGVEALTHYLQLHAGLHVGLALVDLSIWQDAEGRLLVVPRIPMRTVLVERGIVTISANKGLTIAPPSQPFLRGSSSSRTSTTLSEAEFFDQLEQRRPGLADLIRAFLAQASEIGIVPEYRRSLLLRWKPSPDSTASAGMLDTAGKVWLSNAWPTANNLGRQYAFERYMAAVADLVGGSVKTYTGSAPEVMGMDGKGVDALALLQRGEAWLAAISALIEETKQAVE